MPATILTAAHYDAVRALIAPDVTAAHISDAYLSQPPFAPEAEREVRKRLRAAKVDVAGLTGENRGQCAVSHDARMCVRLVPHRAAAAPANRATGGHRSAGS